MTNAARHAIQVGIQGNFIGSQVFYWREVPQVHHGKRHEDSRKNPFGSAGIQADFSILTLKLSGGVSSHPMDKEKIMSKKRIQSGLAVLAILLSSSLSGVAMAGHDRGIKAGRSGGDFYDYAKVVDVAPVVRVVRVNEPRRECWDEEVPVYETGYRSSTPMILGGIIGGAAGNTMGKGRGKDAATIAGVLLGGSIGRDIGQDHQRPATVHHVTETRCRQVNDYREEERVDGYDVSYRYQGQLYHTRMPYDPGKKVRIRVSVEPAY